MSRRVVQKSERSGVSSALEASHQRLNRLVWVVKSNKKTGKPEDRLLAITNHRVVTYKKSAVGAIKECQNGHLYDLNTIVYQHENEMELHFKDWFIKFSHFEANSLFKLIVEQVNRICCRWPKIACPTIDANALLLEAAAIVPFDGSMNNGAPEFLETYRALCSSYDVPAVPDFLRKATLAHTANSHTIRADWHGDQITLGHVQALIGSLLHDKWFDDVSLCLGAADKSIKTMDVIADTLGPALSRMASIKSLSFAHSRLQANGAEIIISSLAANRSMDLRHLDFSFNQLGDRVVKQLVHVLGSCFPRLQSLNLAAVGLTGRGLSDMLDDLVGSIELSKGIETISLAHNTLGKRGGEALAAFLSTPGCGSGLKRLDISSTGIDLTPFSLTLLDSKTEHVPLESISIGGCALIGESIQAFAALLAKKSNKIKSLNVSRMIKLGSASSSSQLRVIKKDSEVMETIIASLILNPGLASTRLRMTENRITSTFARKLASMCVVSASLVSLDVSDCDMGDASLALLFQGFTECHHPRIESLSCGRNSKYGDDSGGAGKWLARMVKHCRHLRTLAIPGGRAGGHHTNRKMKQLWSIDLYPLFEVFKNNTNEQSSKDADHSLALEELDISSNALLDSHMQRLFTSLRQNKSLSKLLWQGNDSTFQTVRNLSHLLHVNHVLTDVGDFMQYINDNNQHARDLTSQINEKLSQNAKTSKKTKINSKRRGY